MLIMNELKSLNFELLRDKRPELANLASFAEAYVNTDPETALFKIRKFANSFGSNVYKFKKRISCNKELSKKVRELQNILANVKYGN